MITARRHQLRLATLALGGLLAVGVAAPGPLHAEQESDDSQEKGAQQGDDEDSESSGSGDDEKFVEVGPGETLGTLAMEHQVSLTKLEEWNDIELGEAESGMKLVVASDEEVEEADDDPKPVIHRISKGETLRGIAHEYNISPSRVKQWNPHLNPKYLQIGDRVRLYVPGRGGESVSWGRATNGRLYNGVALESTTGIEVRSVAQAYGTERVVKLIRAAAADVQARWPNTPDIVVGDLSYKKGGPMPPHKSHQSGRDADLGYYHRGNVPLDDFYRVEQENFDARKNWHFYKTLIDSGEVEFIFISHYLQEPLYEYAKSIGYTDEQLAEIIQYPRDKWSNVGVIRHSPGHDDHSHIRFECGPEDRHCR